MFSESTGSIFCFYCKLFSLVWDNSFTKDGFSNWKKGDEIVSSHESSQAHCKCVREFFNNCSETARIDESMIKATENKAQYWCKVLKRVVSVVRFLAERGLPFRGTDEKIGSASNGNFLGLIELLAEYDPFLKEHIKMYANKGRGNVSYLSKTIYEEFVEAMAKRVMQEIIRQIKIAKYWGLVLDSTPDISHVDQSSVVFRYYLNNEVYERFFCFVQFRSHKGKSMADKVVETLDTNDIEIKNCRAQTYDNAYNMSGEYNGLQANICKTNKIAFYIPCAGHSLNLVGECSVKVCIIVVNFFGVLQEVYVFFNASTNRWELLYAAKANVKNLSKTRWSRRADACKALKNNFGGIYKALETIANDQLQNPDARNEASALITHITKLENAFMTVFWDHVLNRFDATSQYLQKVDVDLITACKMLSSLVDFVKDLRDKFFYFEVQAKELDPHIEQEYADVTKRKITRKLADGTRESSTLSGSDKFRIETYYVIVDKLIVELQRRRDAYNRITELFGFLMHLLDIDGDELKEKSRKLVETYPEDLNDNLFTEWQQFIPLLRHQPRGFFSNSSDEQERNENVLSPLKVLNWMVDLGMIEVFPNIYVAYRLLVTIPIANCETERSFSVLKRIKNMFRSTMLHDRLSALCRLSIEKDLLRSLDFDDLIAEFAMKKARKKVFNSNVNKCE